MKLPSSYEKKYHGSRYGITELSKLRLEIRFYFL
jgi:hypothetical protein